MPTNPFDIDNLDPHGRAITSLKKGDVPGHAFHGNQYAQGSGELRDRALQTLKDVQRGNSAGSASEHSNIAHAHDTIAAGMVAQAASLTGAKQEAMQKAAQAHTAAADAHIQASAANAKLATQSIKPASSVSRGKMDTLALDAKIASEDASYASATADEATKRV